MRIIFVLENHYPNIGGVETLFKNLTESLVVKGYQITVLTNQYSPELKKRENLNGVDIIRVPFRNRYLFTLLGIFPAIKYASKHDMIHTTSYNAAIPAFFAGLFARKKVIITFHEVWGKLWFGLPYMNKFSLSLHYLFEKGLLWLPFYKYVAVSEFTKASLEGVGIKSNRIELIHNGINYEEMKKKASSVNDSQPSPKDLFRFIYFGRLGISKGLDLILDAIPKLKEEGLEFIFTLVIPTLPESFHNLIKETITKNDISDLVEIKSDLEWRVLKQEIRISDAVVIPSYSEGFCFTAVESMAMEVPIISSGRGALEEVVSGHHLQMKSHDASALAQAMREAMEGNWDFTERRKYTLDASIEKYKILYEEVSIGSRQ